MHDLFLVIVDPVMTVADTDWGLSILNPKSFVHTCALYMHAYYTLHRIAYDTSPVNMSHEVWTG